MSRNRTTLQEWKEENPLINPFSNCENIQSLGGATLYWEEFYYRYFNRDIFLPEGFVSAIERVFKFNKYKYERLLATTTQVYDIFSNYKVQKTGSEETEYDVDKNHTGTDTRTLNLSNARTDNLSENITETPRVETTTVDTPTIKTKETVTPTVKEKETVTPTVKTKETDTKGIITTVTVTPEGYTDEISRTTFDSALYNPVEKKVHTAGVGGTTTTTPSGTSDTKTTEVLSGDTQTIKEVVSGNTETVNEVLSGNNRRVVSNTGTDQTAKTNTGTSTLAQTGTDATGFNSTQSTDGTETLTFNNRIDSGYMYREPQNAIRDERDIAVFAILDTILSDVERATLLSIY